MADRITFLGHATVLLELGGTRILTDPVLRERFLLVRRHVALPDPRHLEDVDAVLISHLHHDHLDFRSLRALDGNPPVIVGKGGGRTLRRRRFRRVDELSPGERTSVDGVEIEATRAAHDGRRFKLGPPVEALGYLARTEARGVYFAADTDLFPEMAELAGRVDVALLPIGGWGPKIGEGHLDPARAAEAAAVIRPRVVVPIHWGTYLRPDLVHRSPDLLDRHPGEFEAEVARRAPDVEVRVLRPGETLDLDSGARPPDV